MPEADGRREGAKQKNSDNSIEGPCRDGAWRLADGPLRLPGSVGAEGLGTPSSSGRALMVGIANGRADAFHRGGPEIAIGYANSAVAPYVRSLAERLQGSIVAARNEYRVVN